ncbi:MAG: hypothetical protein ACXWEG_10710 [Actinomycetota bacterium]
MRRAIVVLVVIATAAIVVSANASAGAGRQRVYEGTMGNGDQSIKLVLVLRADKAPALEELDFDADMTCDDGTSQRWAVGMGWAGRLPTLPSHTLDLDLVDPSSGLHIHGKVQAVHGEGTFEYKIPGLTADEQPQLCTTGELPWTASRTMPPVEGPPPPPPSVPTATPSPSPSALQVVWFVTAGGVRVTMTRMA